MVPGHVFDRQTGEIREGVVFVFPNEAQIGRRKDFAGTVDMQRVGVEYRLDELDDDVSLGRERCCLHFDVAE